MRSWLISCSVLVAVPAHADCPRDGKVIPVAHGSVAVDGNLDDATWKAACFIEDFEQKTPAFGARPSRRVTAAVAIDGDTLYVAARMWSDGPADIDAALTQRDDTGGAERFIVSLDPSHTRRLAYSFAVTAAGVRADWIHTDDTEGARDSTWNPVWRASTRMLGDGWTAELAMPLSQLRLPATPQATWGINFNWYIPRRNEDVFWRAVPPDRTAWASWFGELTELPRIERGLGFELLPYATHRLTILESLTDPLSRRVDGGIDGGLDAKFRPLSGLTVAATINPDFGQVDVDPQILNLTAFEIRLPEKRPFFIENAPLFSDAGGAYFYSRRIGGPPHTLPMADKIALPSQIRILGAATAGGFVADHTQIAVLGALTDSADADARFGQSVQRIAIAPLTGWAAARIEHQIGASVLGATATAVERDVGNSSLAALLPSSALVGGGDARLRTDDGTYDLFLFGGVSGVFGTGAAIETVEESSAHYFQRPDATDYLQLDKHAHRLIGWHAGATGSKRAGPWQGNALVNIESPGFELNDLGVLQSADDIDVSADVKRTETAPGERLLSWNVGAGASTSWNFGGLHKSVDLRTSGDITSNAFNTASLAVDVATPGATDDLTRGGPTMRVGWVGAVTLAGSTPRGRAQQLSATVTTEISPTLPQGVIASATATSRITPALRLDVTPQLTWFTSRRQYVATVDGAIAGGGENTFGSRYLFGELHRKEAQIELRATWSLSPELVLTLYAQPFVSVGRYPRLGELAAAGSSDVRWYDTTAHTTVNDMAMRQILDGASAFSIDEPDFTIASLRSTAVLRWELAPGSTLFVVWQQSRSGTDPRAQTLHSATPGVVTNPGTHSVAIKLSYWFG